MAKKMTKREAASVSWRPTVAGSHYAVSSGHYLATAAAMRVLDAGGNAVDAGVTATMALSVLQPDIVSFAGVAPTLVYLKAENRVISLAGLGYWPAATDVARLRAEGGKSVPEGILRQVHSRRAGDAHRGAAALRHAQLRAGGDARVSARARRLLRVSGAARLARDPRRRDRSI